jgi:hypothetical protein
MNLRHRLASQLIVAVAALLTVTASTAHAAQFRVDATVTASFASGPVPSATGSFSFRFDNDFVMGLQPSDKKNWPVQQFQMSLNPIGPTTFTTSNVEGYVFYNQGHLRQILVGGVGPTILDENSVGGNSHDFYISLLLQPGNQLDTFLSSPGNFTYANMNPQLTIFQGQVVRSGTSITITPVPEPATGALAATAAAVAPFVRRRRKKRGRESIRSNDSCHLFPQ